MKTNIKKMVRQVIKEELLTEDRHFVALKFGSGSGTYLEFN